MHLFGLSFLFLLKLSYGPRFHIKITPSKFRILSYEFMKSYEFSSYLPVKFVFFLKCWVFLTYSIVSVYLQTNISQSLQVNNSRILMINNAKFSE